MSTIIEYLPIVSPKLCPWTNLADKSLAKTRIKIISILAFSLLSMAYKCDVTHPFFYWTVLISSFCIAKIDNYIVSQFKTPPNYPEIQKIKNNLTPIMIEYTLEEKIWELSSCIIRNKSDWKYSSHMQQKDIFIKKYTHPGQHRSIVYSRKINALLVLLTRTSERDKLLGQGASKIVKRAIDPFQGVSYASPRLKPQLSKQLTLKQKENELRGFKSTEGLNGFAQLFTSIEYPTSPSIAESSHLTICKTRFFITYANRGSLFDMIDNASLSKIEKWRITEGLLQALTFLHERGFIHRDIKPDNILLVEQDGLITPLLTDFGGLCKIKVNKLSKAGCGSPHWVSPEYAKANMDHLEGKAVDGRVITEKHDIWSMGMTLYTMLKDGYLPGWVSFSTSLWEVYHRIYTNSTYFEHHTEIHPNSPDPYHRVLHGMLKSVPEHRNTAREASDLFLQTVPPSWCL